MNLLSDATGACKMSNAVITAMKRYLVNKVDLQG
jgi:hypothetical protein